VITAIEAYVARNQHTGHFLILILVLLGITWIFRIDGFVVIEIDGTAFDDDVATVCHVSSPFGLGWD